jgi:hypothetical protein
MIVEKGDPASIEAGPEPDRYPDSLLFHRIKGTNCPGETKGYYMKCGKTGMTAERSAFSGAVAGKRDLIKELARVA